MRLFVALEASEALRAEVARLVAAGSSGRSDVKWVEPANAHWTLHFFGETPEARVPGILAAMREAARPAPPFELELGPAGAFPSETSPRILWVGLSRGEAELGALAQRVRSSLASRGFEVEARPFKAHLTLGRARGPRGAKAAAARVAQAAPKGTMRAERVSLMQSKLSPEGPTYAALERVELGA